MSRKSIPTPERLQKEKKWYNEKSGKRKCERKTVIIVYECRFLQDFFKNNESKL